MDTRVHEDESASELLRGALDDVKEMVSAEIDKFRAESHEAQSSAKFGAGGLAVLAIATYLLGEGCAWVLHAIGLPPWAAFGIASFVIGTIGAAIVLGTKRRVVDEVTEVPIGIGRH